MKKKIPSSTDSDSNTPVIYNRTITVPSITLTKDDFNSLLSILAKTGHTPAFDIETNQEKLTFTDIKFLANQKWPANIKQLTFHSGYSIPSISGYIYTPDLESQSNITLTANDIDWISARTEELRLFLHQHHNRHHIFHAFKYTLAQGLLLAGLLSYWFASSILEDSPLLLIFTIIAIIYAVWALYGALLPKVFPYLVLDPEQQSVYTGLRSALKFLIPAIFVTLLGTAIFISLS